MDPYARHLARCFGPAGGLRAVRATPAMRKTSVKNSVKNGITRPRRVGKRMLPHWEHHGPLGLCAEIRSVGYVSMICVSCEAQLIYEYTSRTALRWNSARARIALRWNSARTRHSAGTPLALGSHSAGIPLALGSHSAGTPLALRSNSAGTPLELRSHSLSSHSALWGTSLGVSSAHLLAHDHVED